MAAKKSDLLNAELTKAEVYNKLEQKCVTAWSGSQGGNIHVHSHGTAAFSIYLQRRWNSQMGPIKRQEA